MNGMYGLSKVVDGAVDEVVSQPEFKTKLKELVTAEIDKTMPSAISAAVGEKVRDLVRQAFYNDGDLKAVVSKASKEYMSSNHTGLKAAIEKATDDVLETESFVVNAVRNHFSTAFAELARVAVSDAAKSKARRDAKAKAKKKRAV